MKVCRHKKKRGGKSAKRTSKSRSANDRFPTGCEDGARYESQNNNSLEQKGRSQKKAISAMTAKVRHEQIDDSVKQAAACPNYAGKEEGILEGMTASDGTGHESRSAPQQ
jgi:hypothetical protein